MANKIILFSITAFIFFFFESSCMIRTDFVPSAVELQHIIRTRYISMINFLRINGRISQEEGNLRIAHYTNRPFTIVQQSHAHFMARHVNAMEQLIRALRN